MDALPDSISRITIPSDDELENMSPEQLTALIADTLNKLRDLRNYLKAGETLLRKTFAIKIEQNDAPKWKRMAQIAYQCLSSQSALKVVWRFRC
jgi:hypothetical protein